MRNDALRRKFDGIKYAVSKIEEVLYDVSVRKLGSSGSAAAAGAEANAADAGGAGAGADKQRKIAAAGGSAMVE